MLLFYLWSISLFSQSQIKNSERYRYITCRECPSRPFTFHTPPPLVQTLFCTWISTLWPEFLPQISHDWAFKGWLTDRELLFVVNYNWPPQYVCVRRTKVTSSKKIPLPTVVEICVVKSCFLPSVDWLFFSSGGGILELFTWRSGWWVWDCIDLAL